MEFPSATLEEKSCVIDRVVAGDLPPSVISILFLFFLPPHVWPHTFGGSGLHWLSEERQFDINNRVISARVQINKNVSSWALRFFEITFPRWDIFVWGSSLKISSEFMTVSQEILIESSTPIHITVTHTVINLLIDAFSQCTIVQKNHTTFSQSHSISQYICLLDLKRWTQEAKILRYTVHIYTIL